MQLPSTPRRTQTGRVAPNRSDPTRARRTGVGRAGRGGAGLRTRVRSAGTDLMVRVSHPRMAVSFAVATWEQL